MNHKSVITVIMLILAARWASASEVNITYKRKIVEVEAGWHKIFLPADLYQHARSDLNDLRIMGITADNDTIEAPYLIQYEQGTIEETQAESAILNSSRRGRDYFFTLEVPSSQALNKIQLQFSQQNFDWLVALAGSHDQKEWFEILENYRLVSIHNALADYTFSTLSFSNSNYAYYRIQIESDQRPTLKSASMHHTSVIEGMREDYPIARLEVTQKDKNTILDVQLNAYFPVSNLQIEVGNVFDYYRRARIEYLADSFQTEKGWQYRYRPLKMGTVTSLEENVFKLDKTLLKHIRVIINNQDNEPLNIERCRVWGYKHVLIARFTKQADYYLVYGDRTAAKPSYDLGFFSDRIPYEVPELTLLGEESIRAQHVDKKKELFISKNLLWALLIVILATLGYFSFRMLTSQRG